MQRNGVQVIQRPSTVPTPEPSTAKRPRVLPGGRRAGDDSTLRAFLRPGVWTLAASVTLVVLTGVVTYLVVRSSGPGAAADAEVFRALGSRPLDAAEPDAIRQPPAAASGTPFAVASTLAQAARPALALVEKIERGHATGQWSIARKVFDPCPGEDVERVAWIDASSRIVKLTATRDGGAVVEQWFDADGNLRGVRAASAGAGWSVRALLGDGGAVVHREATGAAPALDALRLARGDPSSAFFATPRCEPQKR